MKHQRTVAGWIFSLLAVAVLSVLYLFYALSPVGAEGEPREFTVAQGEGVRDIAERLEHEGFIRSARALKAFAFLSGSAHRLKPGEYLLSPSFSTSQIVRLFVAGVPEDIRIVIREGTTFKEIESALANAGILPEGGLSDVSLERFRDRYPFLGDAQSLEGFLFPDTYRFFPDSPPEKVVERFLDTWKAKVLPIVAGSDEVVYDILVKASLLEKEIRFDDEKPAVAGIFNKRIQLGMPLQVDAALVYAKCEGRFETCPSSLRALTEKDLKLDSAFNTYRRLGLPPTPISNPGLGSIRAAVLPQESPFLYYLSDPETHRTVFSETFEEHRENRLRYLQ